MDAYQEYKRLLKDEEKHDETSSTLGVRVDPNKLDPDMPRFDSYFEAKSQGVHPFDRIANSFDESEVRTQADNDLERQQEEALYKRELMGRLMGMKLTPR